MRRFSVIQGGTAPGEGGPRAAGCAEVADRILRRRLAALRRPLRLVGAAASPPPARAPRRGGARGLGGGPSGGPPRPIARGALLGVRGADGEAGA